MSMPTPEVEEFAKALVRQVRDATVRNCDAFHHPQASSPVARRWRTHTDCVSAIVAAIPDVVDEAVFNLLSAIDQGSLHLCFVNSSGRVVDLTEEGMGELAGWYMGSGGWRAMFSEERHVDDFADLGG